MKTRSLIFMVLIAVTSHGFAGTLKLRKARAGQQVEKLFNASFEQTLERYPSPYGVIQQLMRIFPGIEKDQNITNTTECLKTAKNSSLIGVIDPMQGGALEDTPGPLFYPYFSNCIREIANSSYIFANPLKLILGEELFTEVEKIAGSTKIFYKYLNPDLQLAVTKRFIYFLAGPEVILRESKLIGSENVFGVPLESESDLAAFLSENIILLKNSDGSDLNLINYYAEIAIVLRLGPLLKH